MQIFSLFVYVFTIRPRGLRNFSHNNKITPTSEIKSYTTTARWNAPTWMQVVSYRNRTWEDILEYWGLQRRHKQNATSIWIPFTKLFLFAKIKADKIKNSKGTERRQNRAKQCFFNWLPWPCMNNAYYIYVLSCKCTTHLII